MTVNLFNRAFTPGDVLCISHYLSSTLGKNLALAWLDACMQSLTDQLTKESIA